MAQGLRNACAPGTRHAGRVFYDGFNLSLAQGTGVATYTRMLAQVVRDLGYEIGVVYDSSQNLRQRTDCCAKSRSSTKDRRSRRRSPGKSSIVSPISCAGLPPIKPLPVAFDGVVVHRQFETTLAGAASGVCGTSGFLPMLARISQEPIDSSFGSSIQDPTIFPLHLSDCRYARNLHATFTQSMISCRCDCRSPPSTTSGRCFACSRKSRKQADHIVTVSENSKRDIIELLGVEENRVTNTYQAVHFPAAYRERPEEVIAEQLEGSFGLEFNEYLLFFGALGAEEERRSPDRRLSVFRGRYSAGAGRWRRLEQRGRNQADRRTARSTAFGCARQPSRQADGPTLSIMCRFRCW